MIAARRHIALEGTHNIRDLGGYLTKRGTLTPWRRFLRADSPHRLSIDGQERLRSEGVSTVIDLRSRAEVTRQPNPLAAHPGVHYVNRPIFDELAPHTQAAPSDGGNPLPAFYRTALDERHEALRDVMVMIAAAREGAVMFHCTAGKDRTGLVAALLLGLAEVGAEDISADYALTERLITGLVAEFLQAAHENGGDVEAYARLLKAPASSMRETLSYVESRYDSVPRYLDLIGVPRGDIAVLRDRLHDDCA